MSEYDTDDMTLEQFDKQENRNKICAYCNKQFFLPYMVDLTHYAYKLTNPMIKGKKTIKNHGSTLWFCSWSCISAFRKSGKCKTLRDDKPRGTSISDKIRNRED